VRQNLETSPPLHLPLAGSYCAETCEEVDTLGLDWMSEPAAFLRVSNIENAGPFLQCLYKSQSTEKPQLQEVGLSEMERCEHDM
jgi:hypothetical protein